MRSFKIVGVMLAAVIFFACGKSEKERAAEKFALATSLYQKGDTITALQQLDSVQSLFPNAFDVAGKAKELSNKINSEALFRKQQQLDLIDNRLTQLETLFDKEKTEYDRFTQYVPRMQKFDRRWNQSFIEVHLDERGDLYISSNYYGSEWLNHTGIRVYDGIFQARTDSVALDDPNNHHSEFMNLHWEKVSYKNGKDNGVIQFVADNADRNLKAVFLGKRMFYIVLEAFDKKAIKDALQLSNALKRKAALQKEIRELKSRLN
jgi:hypothetical protein